MDLELLSLMRFFAYRCSVRIYAILFFQKYNDWLPILAGWILEVTSERETICKSDSFLVLKAGGHRKNKKHLFLTLLFENWKTYP